MSDDAKKEIYSVAVFPRSDLSHLMAGTPPDKDFSNAKPANQVSANTFQAYIEPFVRPLMEEDIAWLKEKVSDLPLLRRFEANSQTGRSCHSFHHAPTGKEALQGYLGRRGRVDEHRQGQW